MYKTKIVSIKKIGKEHVYDFQVPDYNNFILENKIVVHNCGKSTLAWHIANRVHTSSFRQPNTYIFKPEEDLLFTQREFLEAILKRWKDTFIVDEAINTVFNRDFYGEQQKKIIKSLNMNRDHFNLIIMCIPSFSALDTQIRSLCKMRLTVVKRGVAIVHTPIKSIYAKDVWDTSHNEKIEKEWLKTHVSKPRYSRLTTFRGFLSFPDLTPKQRERYEQIKVEKRNQIMVDDETDGGKSSSLDKLKVSDVATRLLTLLKEKRINSREEFDNMCLAFNQKPLNVQNTLSRILRNEGETDRFRSLLGKSIEGVPKKIDESEKEEETISVPIGF